MAASAMSKNVSLLIRVHSRPFVVPTRSSDRVDFTNSTRSETRSTLVEKQHRSFGFSVLSDMTWGGRLRCREALAPGCAVERFQR